MMDIWDGSSGIELFRALPEILLAEQLLHWNVFYFGVCDVVLRIRKCET